jgi:hypothetical protein
MIDDSSMWNYNLLRSNIHLKLYEISIEFTCSQTIHFCIMVNSSSFEPLFTIQIVYFFLFFVLLIR